MDPLARDYVRLVLALGLHDRDYVDAYYGPPEWRTAVEARAASLGDVRDEATGVRRSLDDVLPDATDEMTALRHRFLAKQLDALIARIDLISGRPMSFDEESAALYDVVDPGRPDEFYAEAIAALEPLLPGDGSLPERYERLRAQFYIPADRLETVFAAAVEAARERTKGYIALPEEESFRVELVKDQVWGAYNWYEGKAHSLIQVNTDSPLAIDAMVGLACHEGYPGHHVYNALLEGRLARERGWVEFTVYPLYSPQSLIAEGTAEYGVGLCFPKEERRAFEREVLFPLAGLDLGPIDEYDAARALLDRLGYASNDAARRLLDGQATRETTVDWLVRYGLSTPERAERRVRFIEHNRSYVVTYNLGQDLVRDYVDSHASTPDERWAVFAHLLSTPQVPSNLR